MEIIIGAVIIIILLLILGVPWNLIVMGLMLLLLVAMLLFFIVTLILMLMSKPTRGKLLRIMQHEVVGTYAIYDIEGEEYKNTFPAEIMFVDRIYHVGREYPVRLLKGKKKYMLYDWYTWIIIGVGLLLSGGGLAVMGWFLSMLAYGVI